MVGSWLRSCLFDWTYWMQAPMHVLFQSCHELLWAYILSRKPVWQKETCMSFPFMTLDSFRFKIESSSIWLLDCKCDIEDLISRSLGLYFLFVVAYGRLKLWKWQTMQTMQPHVMICCCSPQDVTAFGAAGSALGTPEDVHPRGTLPPAAALKGSCTIQCITKTYKNVLMDVVSQGTWCLSQSQPRSVLTEDVDGCRILLSHHPDGEKIWESINHVRLLDTVNQHSVALLVELWRRLEKYAAMTMLEHIALGHGMPKDSKAIVVIDRSWPGRTLSCCEGASCMDFWREVPSKESSANFPIKMF